GVIAEYAHTWHGPSLAVASVTLATMLLWPRLRTPVPAHLPALLVGTGVALWLTSNDMSVETIGSRFSYLLPDGSTGQGIPPTLPSFEWPWLRANDDGSTLALSWQLARDLLPAASAVAQLAAPEPVWSALAFY